MPSLTPVVVGTLAIDPPEGSEVLFQYPSLTTYPSSETFPGEWSVVDADLVGSLALTPVTPAPLS